MWSMRRLNEARSLYGNESSCIHLEIRNKNCNVYGNKEPGLGSKWKSGTRIVINLEIRNKDCNAYGNEPGLGSIWKSGTMITMHLVMKNKELNASIVSNNDCNASGNQEQRLRCIWKSGARIGEYRSVVMRLIKWTDSPILTLFYQNQ